MGEFGGDDYCRRVVVAGDAVLTREREIELKWLRLHRLGLWLLAFSILLCGAVITHGCLPE